MGKSSKFPNSYFALKAEDTKQISQLNKEKRDHQRRQILDELIVMTSEAGLYQIDEQLK